MVARPTINTEHPTMTKTTTNNGPRKAGKQPARAAAPTKGPKGRKAGKNAPAPTPRAASGKRAQILADAEAGIVPPAPDFSAATHTRFRKRHAELLALVEAGDVRALKAFEINPVSSSPKALMRYRDLALIALEAKRKADAARAR
jgi:hypothetical protein